MVPNTDKLTFDFHVDVVSPQMLQIGIDMLHTIMQDLAQLKWDSLDSLESLHLEPKITLPKYSNDMGGKWKNG